MWRKALELHEIEKYLGIPYKEHGRKKSEGFDCYGLVKTIIEERTGIELPDVYYTLEKDQTEKLLKENNAYDFVDEVKLEEIQPLDLVMIKEWGSRIGSHIGIYVGHGIILHSTHNGVLATRITKLKHFILGIYRLKNDYNQHQT